MIIFFAYKLKAAQPGFNARENLIFLQRTDIVYPSKDKPRKIKPGRTRRHDVNGVEFCVFTTDGRIVKGQTRLADDLKCTDNFGFTAENLNSDVRDAVPSVLSSFSFQSVLL